MEEPVCQDKSVPKVTFTNLDKTVEFEHGKLPYADHGKPESLLDVALNFGIQLEHACGGSCACTTCHVIVKQGDDNLSEADDDELDRLDMAPGLTLHSRLGCQAVVKGDVTVEIPSWNRNYVSEGGGSMNLGEAIPAGKK
jgi:ferredoxin, 2Fe-2S